MRTFNFVILLVFVSFFSIFTSNNANATTLQFANIDENATYFIMPAYSNKTFDIAGGSKVNGAKLVQWEKHNGTNQQFRFESKGSGYYMIVNVNSGKALDVPGASYNDGVQLVQWDKHGGENQQFSFEKVGTDTYIIMNRRSKKVLDVYSGSRENGAKITQYTKHGRENQQFKLIKVAAKPTSNVVNGYSVNYIDFGQNGNKLGVYEQIGDKKWREVGSKRGASSFNFVETQRDEWSVYLLDKSRNVNIQLDLHTKKVMYSVGGGKRSPIYEVMNPSSKMNGWLVSEVTYGSNRGAKLGTFVEKENKAWQEISLKDGKHNFTETHRDQWSVYLQDKSRNVFIQLDLHTKKVMYSVGNGAKRPLYEVMTASSKKQASTVGTSTVKPTPERPVSRRPTDRRPVSKPASTVVNGYSVNYIAFGQNGNKLGVYEQIGDKKWREVGSKRGASSFNFVETQRDEWSVYLLDKSRNVNIQLDLHTKKVMYSVGGGKRSPIYEVMNPSSKMNGWLVSEVTYGSNRGAKLGTFVEKENKAWQEISLKDGKHNFTETHRDQWSVYLQDKSRNVFIQLDLHTKKVMYSVGNKTKTYLYTISGAK